MPRRIIKSPWCCGQRMTGNDKNGYRCTPLWPVTVKLTPLLVGTGWCWYVELGDKALDFGAATGPRSAANAATRCLCEFQQGLTTRLNRRP